MDIKKFNIQIVSDLHLEFITDENKIYDIIQPSSNVLALLGDICCCACDDDFLRFIKFIKYFREKYDHILYIPGNHEYYINCSPDKVTSSMTMEGIDHKIESFFKDEIKLNIPGKELAGLHYLNNKSVKLAGYIITGSTLWSNIKPPMYPVVTSLMNDYRKIYTTENGIIRKIEPVDIARIHQRNVRYLKSVISRANNNNIPVIVFTHHRPYLIKNFDENTLDTAYCSDQSNIIKPPVVLWAYGHTHIKDITIFGSTLLYSLPKGYTNQHTLFKKKQYLSLPIIDSAKYSSLVIDNIIKNITVHNNK